MAMTEEEKKAFEERANDPNRYESSGNGRPGVLPKEESYAYKVEENDALNANSNDDVDVKEIPLKTLDEHDKSIQHALDLNTPEGKEAAANLMSTGKLKWDEVLRQRKRNQEELDADKKAARERRDRLERNLVGASQMVGALGNFYNAAKGDNGRSVSVGDTIGAVDKKLATKKAERDAKMKELRAAQGDYTKYVSDLFTDADKATRERLKAENALREKQREFDQNLEFKYYDAKAKIDDRRAANAQKVKESQARIADYQSKAALREKQGNKLEAKNAQDAIKSHNSNYVDLKYNDGKNTMSIPKSAWTPENIAAAYRRLSNTAKEAFKLELVKKIADAKKQIANPDVTTKYIPGMSSINVYPESEKWVTMNEKYMREAIGLYIDDPNETAMLDYLLAISNTQPTSSADNDDDPDLDFTGVEVFSEDERKETQQNDENSNKRNFD